MQVLYAFSGDLWGGAVWEETDYEAAGAWWNETTAAVIGSGTHQENSASALYTGDTERRYLAQANGSYATVVWGAVDAGVKLYFMGKSGSVGMIRNTWNGAAIVKIDGVSLGTFDLYDEYVTERVTVPFSLTWGGLHVAVVIGSTPWEGCNFDCLIVT